MGLLSLLAEIIEESDNKKKDDSELIPCEQELVDKGEYEPYQFEEEDMDEDDYYYEDD